MVCKPGCMCPVHWIVNEEPIKSPGPHDVVGDPRYLKLLDEMREMHLRKGADYGIKGDAFGSLRSCEECGIQPQHIAIVRANEKMTRAKAWIRTGSLKNEGIRDTLLDLASYALAAVVFLEDVQPIKY